LKKPLARTITGLLLILAGSVFIIIAKDPPVGMGVAFLYTVAYFSGVWFALTGALLPAEEGKARAVRLGLPEGPLRADRGGAFGPRHRRGGHPVGRN